MNDSTTVEPLSNEELAALKHVWKQRDYSEDREFANLTGRLLATIDALRERLATVEAALRKYGRHHREACYALTGCLCGLADVWPSTETPEAN